MSVWSLRPADDEMVESIARALVLPRPVARMLYLRGYQNVADAKGFLASRDNLDYLETMPNAPGMEKAIVRIRKAVTEAEPLVIYGDYDCDGVTSATILYRYLKRGLKANVEAYLPDRFRDGYGVTPAAVERLAAKGVKLILTCDNGITAFAAANRAKELGVDMVVTDHHLRGEELPDVHALVHPQVEFNHLRDLCGAGVAFLFVVAMEGGLNKRMESFFDFTTLGTVGDVVPLNGPNRPLVWAGMQRYREGRVKHPGVLALGEVSKTTFSTLTARDVGFNLVPRLNAAGRLETPDVGFKLLATNDPEEANDLALRLNAINADRRDLSADLEAAVYARIDKEWDLEAEPFIVLADSEFHHGVTGIIAGRVKEKYRAPVLLFSGHGDDLWKASGRSPEGLHLYNAMLACREHFVGFGGHAGAAGGSARPENIPALRKALNQHLRDIGWQRPADAVWLDAEMPFGEADEALLDALDLLEPYGQYNPAPVFGLLRARVVGKKVVKEKHLFLKIDDGRTICEVKAWGQAHRADELDGWVRLTYTARMNVWNGQRRVDVVADRIEGIGPPGAIEVTRRPTQAVAIDDARGPDGLCTAIGPDGAGHVILAEVPEDEDRWVAILASASRVTIAWPTATAAEPPLTPAYLSDLYARLADQAIVEPDELAAGESPRLFAAGLAVLRESGLLVHQGKFWRLLAAPDADLPLDGIAAYRAYRDGCAFRARLGGMDAAAIAADVAKLAQPAGV